MYFQSRSLALPTATFFHPQRLEEIKEEKQEEKKEEKEEEEKKKKEEDTKEEKQKGPGPLQMNLLTTVFGLRRDLHRAEEQRARVRRRQRRRGRSFCSNRYNPVRK